MLHKHASQHRFLRSALTRFKSLRACRLTRLKHFSISSINFRYSSLATLLPRRWIHALIESGPQLRVVIGARWLYLSVIVACPSHSFTCKSGTPARRSAAARTGADRRAADGEAGERRRGG